MSKERARTRAQRQADHEALLAERAEQVAAATARRRKTDQRQLRWRRLRLWQHGSGYSRNRDRWAAMGTLVMCILLVTYLVTTSVREVLVVALILIIASPVLVAFIVNRKQS